MANPLTILLGMLCLQCGSPTTNPKFCSRTCAAIFTNKAKPKRPMSGKCADCNIPVTSKRKRCKTCQVRKNLQQQSDRKNSSIGDLRKKQHLQNKHPSWLHAEVRFLCRSWNPHLSKLPCANCGYCKHVELAHINSLSKFPDETLLRIVNDPSNVIQLCRNCHWELDHKLLRIEDLRRQI